MASALGSSLAWYAFFLYGANAILVFPNVYFPEHAAPSAPLIAFWANFVGFLGTPFGAAFFGHLGDRFGRKPALIATLLTLGLATAAVGLVPGQAQIGTSSLVLLTLLRLVQGFGIGGEWGGSTLLTMERAAEQHRGFATGCSQSGVAAGLILGNVVPVIVSALTGGGYVAWAWRLPFVACLGLCLVGLWIRLSVAETPVFVRLLEERRTTRTPVLEALRHHWPEILLVALVRMAELGPMFIFISVLLTYGPQQLRLDSNLLLFSVLLGAAISLVVVPSAGYASDYLGRKRVYLAGAVSMMAFAFPYFFLLGTRLLPVVMFAIVISMIPWAIQFGPLAALTAEAFSDRLRYTGAALGFQGASLVAGAPAAFLLLGGDQSLVALPLYIVASGAVTLLALALLPDGGLGNPLLERSESVGPASLLPSRPPVERPVLPAEPMIAQGQSFLSSDGRSHAPRGRLVG